MATKINELLGNAQQFAAACFDDSSIVELKAALAGDADGSDDCDNWGITLEERRRAISAALKEKYEVQKALIIEILKIEDMNDVKMIVKSYDSFTAFVQRKFGANTKTLFFRSQQYSGRVKGEGTIRESNGKYWDIVWDDIEGKYIALLAV